MSIDLDTITASIAAVAITGVTVRDTSNMTDAVNIRDCPLLSPRPFQFVGLSPIERDTYGGPATSQKSATFTLTYRYFHSAIGQGRGMYDEYPTFIDKIFAIADAIIAADDLNGVVDINLNGMPDIGVVEDGAGNQFWGTDLEFNCLIFIGGAASTFYRSLLLSTGQLTSYGSGSGVDDGAYRKGVAKNYTVLTTGAYAGTTSITINSKTDVHANACVLDNKTGLMWSRTCSATVGPASNGYLPWTTTGAGATEEGIFPYCAAANAAALAGYTDWRIANIFELYTLTDHEAPTGYPDSTAFPAWVGDSVHSSTTRTNDTSNSEGINGYAGYGIFNQKISAKPCCLVRGG